MLSFDDIKGLVKAAVLSEHAGCSYAWIRDIYPDAVVYNVESPQGVCEPCGNVYYRRTYKLTEAKDGTVSIALGAVETVTTKTEYQTVASFSLTEFSATDEFVVWKGKVFEAGSYPDKGVDFTHQDLIDAAARFNPVPNDLEHMATILDGGLGDLNRVEARDGGAWLYGEVAIPKWLAEINETNGVTALPVSLAFDQSKTIVGNALTLRPRIKDAQVLAAFAEFAGKRNSTKDTTDLQSVHDLAVKLGANCGTKYTALPKEKKPMKLKDALGQIVAVFSGGGNIDPETEIGGVETPVAPTFNAETVALKAELAKAREAQIKGEAVKFTDKLVADRRILPAQAEAVQASFCLAAKDDLLAGGAKFSDGGEFVAGERTKALTDSWSTAVQHTLTQEQLKDAGTVFASTEGRATPQINAQEIYSARARAEGGK